jgi:hypothetical protein
MAVLNARGTTPEARETLTSLAIGAARTFTPSFRMEAGISSTPRALVGFNLRIVFAILVSFANRNAKNLLLLFGTLLGQLETI